VRVSVHMMVRSGALVVGRALKSVAGFATEVCFVDTGSTDGTPDVIKRACDELGLGCGGVAVGPVSRPDLFFPDAPTSWRRKFESTFTGLPLLRDWAEARNLGLDMCAGQYVCKLDADDVFEGTPDGMCLLIEHLESHPDVLAAACPYVVWSSSRSEVDMIATYTRIWRNRPDMKFREVCHENVDHLRSDHDWIYAGGDEVVFSDRRDSGGVGARTPHRNFKVLLREYERLEAAGVAPSAHLCMYLADEAVAVDPRLPFEVFSGNFRGIALRDSDAAWAYLIMGRCHEVMGSGRSAVVDAYGQAAARGSLRAVLLRALHDARAREAGWEEQLRGALSLCEGAYYPRGAKISEVARARAYLLGGGDGR
jgi:hypothetical protein